MPIVSILLPVYNDGKYLQESVVSILSQTYTSFELLILDDGSTDGFTGFLAQIADERIHVIKRKHNYIDTSTKAFQSSVASILPVWMLMIRCSRHS